MAADTPNGFSTQSKASKPSGLKASEIPVNPAPKTAIHATAGEPFIIPMGGLNVAGGKELLRTMLSKEAATA